MTFLYVGECPADAGTVTLPAPTRDDAEQALAFHIIRCPHPCHRVVTLDGARYRAQARLVILSRRRWPA